MANGKVGAWMGISGTLFGGILTLVILLATGGDSATRADVTKAEGEAKAYIDEKAKNCLEKHADHKAHITELEHKQTENEKIHTAVAKDIEQINDRLATLEQQVKDAPKQTAQEVVRALERRDRGH